LRDVGRCCGVRLVSPTEGDVEETERVVGRGGLGLGVFAWAEKEEEAQGGQISCCKGHGIVAKVCHEIHVVDELKRNWFDAVGRRVDARIAFELLLEAVLDFSSGREAAVGGPHAGHRLADGAKGVLHCASADRFAAGSDFASAPAGGKDLEERDGVDHIVEHGVDFQLLTIVAPSKPGVVAGSGACRNCAGSERLHCKAIVSAECIAGRR